MDIEHLNKSQIVLLTLLISFVTSIATGIVTVSLMDQAPPVVAQTVNRVIERTIQTVASSTPARSQPAATVVTQEKTVVVKDSDLISQAVAKIEPSIVHIYNTAQDDAVFLSVGFVFDSTGTIVTDSGPLDGRSEAVVSLADGSRVRVFVVRQDADNGIAFLQAATSTDTKAIAWTPVHIASDRAVLGGSLVAISGKTSTRIAPGVITALIPAGAGYIIDTNISSDAILPGSPVINTDGAVVGVSTTASRTSSTQGFIPGAVLLPPSLKPVQ
ncbi:serine protease [Candidatus Kaiserbacteria bacterium]|nr:serine protease [Candidatus Kaiserbacteria bacterium]